MTDCQEKKREFTLNICITDKSAGYEKCSKNPGNKINQSYIKNFRGLFIRTFNNNFHLSVLE